MGFFMDIVRDSRRGVEPRHDAGSMHWDKAVEGHSREEQGYAVDRRAVEPRLTRARLEPSRPGPLPAESRDVKWAAEQFQGPGPEGWTEEAFAESPGDAASPTGARRTAPHVPNAWSERIPRPDSSQTLQRKVFASPSAAVEGPASSGAGLIPDSAPETGARRGEPVPRESRTVSPAIAESRGTDPLSHAEAAGPPHPLTLDLSGPESSPHERPIHSSEAASAREMTGENRPAVPRHVAQAPMEAKPAAAAALPGSTSMVAVSPPGVTSPERSLPQVRIGRVNVIVESDRTTRQPKSPSDQREDLASRTFLRSL